MATSGELHRFMRNGRVRHIARGELLQSSDQPGGVNLVIRGAIKRYMITNEGALGVQIIYGADDFFPLTIVYKELFDQSLYDGPEVFYYEAICPSSVYTVGAAELLKAVEGNTLLYRDILVEAGKHLHSTVQRLENLSLHSSYNRVAHQILYFAKRFGEKKSYGTRVTIPLIQQDIADVLSITRETVSMCMSDLRKKKLITGGKNILIPNVANLKKEAYGSS
jgi:CRP/FNR family transcriptional regulator